MDSMHLLKSSFHGLLDASVLRSTSQTVSLHCLGGRMTSNTLVLSAFSPMIRDALRDIYDFYDGDHPFTIILDGFEPEVLGPLDSFLHDGRLGFSADQIVDIEAFRANFEALNIGLPEIFWRRLEKVLELGESLEVSGMLEANFKPFVPKSVVPAKLVNGVSKEATVNGSTENFAIAPDVTTIKHEVEDTDYVPPVKALKPEPFYDATEVEFLDEEFDEEEEYKPKRKRLKRDRKEQSKRGRKRKDSGGGEDHPCEECGKVLSSKYSLQTHVRFVHQKKSQETMFCDQCDFKTIFKDYLKKHIRLKHGTKCFCEPGKEKKCQNCQLLERTKLSLAEQTEETACEICGKTLQKRCIQKHIEKVHGNDFMFCPHCDFKSTDKRNLRRHVDVVHLKIKDIECEMCGKLFATKSHYQYHYKSKHSTEDSFHYCQQCNYKSYYEMALAKHIKRVHEKIKNYSCDLCGKTFFDITELKSHIANRHEKDGKYKCEQCGKGFNTKNCLQSHIKRDHERRGERQCEACGKVLRSFYDYKKHVLSKHGDQIPKIIPMPVDTQIQADMRQPQAPPQQQQLQSQPL